MVRLRKGSGGLNTLAIVILVFGGTAFFYQMTMTSQTIQEDLEYASGDAHNLLEAHTKREIVNDGMENMVNVSANTRAVELGRWGGGVDSQEDLEIEAVSELHSNQTWIGGPPPEDEIEREYVEGIRREINDRNLVWDCEQPEVGSVERENSEVAVSWMDDEIVCTDRSGEDLVSVATVELQEFEAKDPTNFKEITGHAINLSDELFETFEEDYEEDESLEETRSEVEVLINDTVEDYTEEDFPVHDSEEVQGVEVLHEPRFVFSEEEEDLDHVEYVGANMTLVDHRDRLVTSEPSYEKLRFEWFALIEA